MSIASNNYKAFYTGLGSGFNDCETKEEAINLLLEREKSRGITPVAVIETATKSIVWFNEKLGLKECARLAKEHNLI